jgi:hypothetical protein
MSEREMNAPRPNIQSPPWRTCAAALIIVLSVGMSICGCGGSARDLSTPRAALLGQWEPLTAGAAYIFFSPDTATYLPKESGESIALQYEVVEEDREDFTLKIGYIGQGDTTEPFTIAFSEDRSSFFLYPASVPERLEYSYVGDRQQP